MSSELQYRPLTEQEVAFLEEMFYQALFVRPGEEPYPREIIRHPELQKYYTAWGSRKHDLAIVVEKDQQLIGAVWGRQFSAEFPGYGFIDEQTPEVTIAIQPEFRGQGIGQALLEQIEAAYLQVGISTLSLSVDQLSPAIRLYLRCGYAIYEEAGTAYTMRKVLR